MARRSPVAPGRPAAPGPGPGLRPGQTSLTARARAALVTTPGKLRLLSVLLVAVIVVVWLVDIGVVSHRRSGVTAFRNQSDLVVLAQHIQAELTDADAGAANAFLAGGLEPADQVARFVSSTKGAADDLAQAAADAGTTGPAGADVKALTEQLATYTGLVATARADNREGFPVGAAYLRAASTLLHATMVPAAAALAQTTAVRVNHAEATATGVTDVVLRVLVTLVLLGLLVAVQAFVTRRTRRALNLGLAAATVVGLVLAIVVLGAMASERTAVVNGGERGYAPVARLTAARVLAFQAQGDESAALIARGNGQAYESDLGAAVGRIETLLPAGSTLTSALNGWLAVDANIRSEDTGGHHDAAVALALGHASGDSLPAFGAFDSQLGAAITSQQTSLLAQISKAQRSLRSLPLIATLGAALAIIATLAGIQPRVNEYR